MKTIEKLLLALEKAGYSEEDEIKFCVELEDRFVFIVVCSEIENEYYIAQFSKKFEDYIFIKPGDDEPGGTLEECLEYIKENF